MEKVGGKERGEEILWTKTKEAGGRQICQIGS